MNVILCDDDPKALNEVHGFLREFFDEMKIQVNYSTFFDGKSAVAKKKSYDMAFIDVEMPCMNGLDVAKQLQDTNPRSIIFMKAVGKTIKCKLVCTIT